MARSWWKVSRRAFTDSAKVALASDYPEVDIAVLKATSHLECPPNDSHLDKILSLTCADRSSGEARRLLEAIHKRLADTHRTTVALKTLAVVHRILTDGRPSFVAELLSRADHNFSLSNVKGDSLPYGSDWLRAYAEFLQEGMACHAILINGIEGNPISSLLRDLPALQKLLSSILACRPAESAIAEKYASVIKYNIDLVLKEGIKVLFVTKAGIIDLFNRIFEMSREEALQALEIHRRAEQQVNLLSEFYQACRGTEDCPILQLQFPCIFSHEALPLLPPTLNDV